MRSSGLPSWPSSASVSIRNSGWAKPSLVLMAASLLLVTASDGVGLLGRLGQSSRAEILRQISLGDRAVLLDIRQEMVDDLADGDQPGEVDPGLEPHCLEHEGEILGDD